MRYGKWSRKLFFALVDALGEDAAKLIAKKAMESPDFQAPKYEIDEGQTEALLNIVFQQVGAERLPDILARRLVPKWEEVVRRLVDKNSRCIAEGLPSRVLDPNRQFRLYQPVLDTVGIKECLARLREFYPFKDAEFPSVEEVEARYRAILAWLDLPENEENGVKNLLSGHHLLGVLPKISGNDYGATLESLVDAAGRSYAARFPDRSFTNHRKGELAGKVGIAEGARHGELVKAAREGVVVYVSFRACLQGFSIQADREQEARMPSRCILSGGWDTAMDAMAYPEVLFRDFHTPGLDCAANFWGSPDYSLYFGASDARAYFDFGYLNAGGNYSGGLLLLG